MSECFLHPDDTDGFSFSQYLLWFDEFYANCCVRDKLSWLRSWWYQGPSPTGLLCGSGCTVTLSTPFTKDGIVFYPFLHYCALVQRDLECLRVLFRKENEITQMQEAMKDILRSVLNACFLPRKNILVLSYLKRNQAVAKFLSGSTANCFRFSKAEI